MNLALTVTAIVAGSALVIGIWEFAVWDAFAGENTA